MVDQPDGGGNSDDFNPYEPGDAAVDPAMPSDPTGGEGALQISPTQAPNKPEVSRAIENFNIVLDRAFGPVGGGWLVVFFGYMILAVILGVATVALVPGLAASGLGEAAGGAVLLMVPIFAIVAIGAGSLFVGLTRSLRTVAFGGERAVAGVGEALSIAFERFWSILGMFVGWFLLMALPMGLVMVAGAQLDSPVLAVVGGLFAIVIAVFAAPLFYVVPSTDLSIGASFSKSLEVLTGNFGYLALCFLALLATALLLGCGMAVLNFIPIIGQIIGFALQLALNFFSWIAFVTVFATIEEANGPFDRRMSQGGGTSGMDGGMGGPGAGGPQPGSGSDMEW